LFSSVVLKDIVKRNKVRDVDLLERIIAYIFGGVGTTFSAASISKCFKSESRDGIKHKNIRDFLLAPDWS